MNIQELDTIKKDHGYTLPLLVDITLKDIRFFHGNENEIKFSKISRNKIEQITSIKIEGTQYFGVLLFRDIDEDNIDELILCIKPSYVKVYKFISNKFDFFREIDITEKIIDLPHENDLDIYSIIFYKKNQLLFGTNYGLHHFSLNESSDFSLIFSKFKDFEVWAIEILKNSKLTDHYIIIGLDNKFSILNSNFETVCEKNIKGRIYQIKLYDYDNDGFEEIFLCTQFGMILIYHLFVENAEIKKIKKIYEVKLIDEVECRRNKPAINCFDLKDINSDGNLNILIGGNDCRIKVYDWNCDKKEITNINTPFIYTNATEEIYAIKTAVGGSNQLYLLYVSYFEEISLNCIIYYHDINSDHTRNIIKMIANEIYNDPKNYCFFLGAGFSYYEKFKEKSIPLAKGLIEELVKTFNLSLNNFSEKKYQNSLEYILYYLKKMHKNFDVRTYIQQRFTKVLKIPKSVKILSDLVKAKLIGQIFTVNFDLLLDEKLGNNIKILFKDNDFYPKNIKYPFYVKLHGSCSHIDTIVGSIDETQSPKDSIPLILKRNLLKLFYDATDFIFIGYSFNDVDFIDIFEHNIENNNRNVYIFDPCPTKNMTKIVNNRIKTLEIDKLIFHIFKCKAEEFFVEFNRIIKEIKNSDI